MKSNVLLQGEIGSGKTRSLITLLPEYVDENGAVHKGAGLRTFLLSLEPGAEATLGPNLCTSASSMGIHIKYVEPLSLSWDTMRKWGTLLNTNSLENVLKIEDPSKRQCTQFLQMMDACAAFTCDRCGGEFGDAGEWTESDALAQDSLTGLTTVARHLCVGLKPILSRPEYNPVMECIENYLKLFWGATRCNSILLAHIDREVNPMTGLSGITAHTIGQKLAPRIVKIPDEIILAEYSEGSYTWSTEVSGMVLKCRRLPKGTGLAADFSQLFKDT